LLLVFAALAPAGGLACSLASNEATSTDDVTSVENTGVKSQAIANCWLYATAGWAESLHKGATARDADLSEAYWNYWYWYEQITGGDISLADEISWEGITQGGWWGLGVELIYRYGWMHEGDFIPDADAKAKRHEEAAAAINESLAYGALASPAARRDPKIVRAELNKAWKIGASVVEDLERQFPIVSPPPVATAAADGGDEGGAPPAAAPLPPKPTPLVAVTDRAASGSLGLTRIHAPQELAALGADGTTIVTLADVIGRRAEGTKPGEGIRVGPEAWTELRYTWAPGDEARRRAFVKNVQHALNRRLAVPIAWAISSTATNGEYHPEGVSDWTLTGLHESILVDYEIDDVPGFGTLRVDVRETRPEALEATLDDAARIRFFRIKNSWGSDRAWTEEELRQYGMAPSPDGAAKPNFLEAKPGYNDLYAGYLDLPTTWGQQADAHLGLRYALPRNLRFPIPEPAGALSAEASDAGLAGDGGDAGIADASVSDAGAGKKK